MSVFDWTWGKLSKRAIFWIAVVATFFAFQDMKPAKPEYVMPYFPPQSVHVRSHYRGGTFVEAHNRAASGMRAYANSVNYVIGEKNREIRKKYSAERWKSFGGSCLAGLVVYGLLRMWRADDLKEEQERSAKKSVDLM